MKSFLLTTSHPQKFIFVLVINVSFLLNKDDIFKDMYFKTIVFSKNPKVKKYTATEILILIPHLIFFLIPPFSFSSLLLSNY